MEVWKDIEGYEGLYQISSLGRVKSLERVVKRRSGHDMSVKERIRKQHRHSNHMAYSAVVLNKDGVMKTFLVHRLVANAFIPNFEGKPQVNHINSDPSDNRLENLEWCTAKENQIHGSKNGFLSGAKSEKMRVKLTPQKVRYIRSQVSQGCKQKDVAAYYGVNQRTVSGIVTGVIWKEVA